MFFVIGELINSTRSDVAEALEKKDEAVIRRLARTQAEAGAHAIDVNAGQAVDNEIPDLLWLINVIQNELGADVRLAIDTTSPEAMKAALEACAGRPIINSITNEKSKASLIELAAASDAEVIGLAMGEHGMPKTAFDRVQETRALLAKCDRAKLAHDRLYVDTVCMSVGSSPEQGREVLAATRQIKEELGVRTFTAVSNVSFGLPNRRLLNRTFLAMLMEAGLDGVIMDPTDKRIMDTLCAARALLGADNYCLQYIKRHKRQRRT